MAMQIPMSSGLPEREITPYQLREGLARLTSELEGRRPDDDLIGGMPVTVPLNPQGSNGGTRQAYDDQRTESGYDRKQ
jgi:hypothetical protein